ncbi:MAG: hypothetical protein CSB23_04290 [Deltaproteobacteria bacterium]|nr:MAG: hypothetical protein CSB23_04290 [Deltaproteobacteria bacterium]
MYIPVFLEERLCLYLFASFSSSGLSLKRPTPNFSGASQTLDFLFVESEDFSCIEKGNPFPRGSFVREIDKTGT